MVLKLNVAKNQKEFLAHKTAFRERVVSLFKFVYSSCHIKPQLLKSKADFQHFQEQYQADSGNYVSLKTLKQSERVLFFFDYNKNIVGQYFINVNFLKKSVYLKDVSNSKKKRKKIIKNAHLSEQVKVAEIGAFSVKRSTGGFLKIVIILKAILDATKNKKCSYVLAGSFITSLQEQLQWVLPVELFAQEFSYHGQIRHGKIFLGLKSMVKLRLVVAFFKRLLYKISRTF